MNKDEQSEASRPNPDAPEEGAPATSRPATSTTKRLALIIAGALVLITAVWLIVGMASKTSAPGKDQSASAAQTLFNDMAAAAAGQSRVQLTYAEKSFASKADFEAGTTQDQRYSVAELDAATKEYRAVYANQQGSSTDFAYYTIRRCLEGKIFKPDGFALAYKTLDAAQQALARPFTMTVDSSEADDCSLTDPDHIGRITDGIIPVGLSQAQIEGWLRSLHEADFLQIEDQGMTTYDQKPVRKLRLVTSSLAGAGNFYDAVKKGAGLELTTDSGAPGADSYRLDHMATSDNIDGFYLIDEQTNLPLYSEFTSLSLLPANAEDPASNRSETRTGRVIKQVYRYPATFTLNQSSTINTLE